MVRTGLLVLSSASLAVAFALLGGGCSFLQGGTDGYTLAEAGATPVNTPCTSATDCVSTVCCGDIDAGNLTASCQTACGEPWQQACDPFHPSTCEAGVCATQSCTVTVAGIASSQPISTCAPIPSAYCPQQ